MWSLLPTRLQLLAIVVSTVVIFAGIEAVSDLAGGSNTSPLRFLSLVVSIIGVILAPVANLIWRHIWRWFSVIERITFPDLNGTWKGRITTTWTGPNGESVPDPIPVTVWIRQSLFLTTVRLQTAEAASHSTWCNLEVDRGAGVYRVLYSYDNRPTAKVRARSARHDGFVRLEMHIDTDRQRLVGQYFTDRRTSGDMELFRVSYDS